MIDFSSSFVLQILEFDGMQRRMISVNNFFVFFFRLLFFALLLLCET